MNRVNPVQTQWAKEVACSWNLEDEEYLSGAYLRKVESRDGQEDTWIKHIGFDARRKGSPIYYALFREEIDDLLAFRDLFINLRSTMSSREFIPQTNSDASVIALAYKFYNEQMASFNSGRFFISKIDMDFALENLVKVEEIINR